MVNADDDKEERGKGGDGVGGGGLMVNENKVDGFGEGDGGGDRGGDGAEYASLHFSYQNTHAHNMEVLQVLPFFDPFFYADQSDESNQNSHNNNQINCRKHTDIVGVCNFYIRTADPSILALFPLERSFFVKDYQADFFDRRYHFIDDDCYAVGPLFPVRTDGDGNCLLHAVSIGLWGCHDPVFLPESR